MSQQPTSTNPGGKIKPLTPENDLSQLDLGQIKLTDAAGGEISMEALLGELNRRSAEHGPATPTEQEYLRILHQREQELKQQMKEPITFSSPILTWNGAPILYPLTVNLIQGQTGSHKSRLAEAFCSALLGKADAAQDLGLLREVDLDLLLCYVDTERNLKEQYPFALQSILRRAGYPIEAELPNFRFVSLLEFERTVRFDVLRAKLRYLREGTDRHIVVVLDVLTDCVTDFNRTDQSMALIDLMNQYINQFNVTFICVIHENPGVGGKARGHLGTEAMNKSSTVLQIGFERDGSGNDTDVIRVKALKCRSTARPAPIYLRYSQEAKGLVLADQAQVQNLIDERRPKAQLKDVAEQLEKMMAQKVNQQKELLKILAKHFQASQRTLKCRIEEIQERKTPIHNEKGEPCKLVSSKVGRTVEYHLEPLEDA